MNFRFALTVSILCHSAIFLALLSGFGVVRDEFLAPQIYSVTIEGGKSLGGITQVPKDDKKEQIAPPKKVQAEEPKVEEKKPEIKEEKKEETKVEPEEKEEVVKVEEKPTPKPKPEKEEEKEKPTPKATPKPTPKTLTAAEIDKRLQKAVQRYGGESTSAGGSGFGAGKLGGTGMGGGILVSPAFLRYKELLERHIKTGWRWFDSNAPLVAQVQFKLAPDGAISEVRLTKSSGSREFDDSAIRAVRKASPAPPAPTDIYHMFADAVITFEPE